MLAGMRWINLAKVLQTWRSMLTHFFFVITTFGGAGYGNVIPSTNLEWLVDTFLNLIGSSLFICIFIDFVVEY